MLVVAFCFVYFACDDQLAYKLAPALMAVDSLVVLWYMHLLAMFMLGVQMPLHGHDYADLAFRLFQQGSEVGS